MTRNTLLLCLLLLGGLRAQEVSLSGQVLDPSGVPLDGVLVRLLGADLTTLTGADGRWSIEEGTALAMFPNRVQSTSRIAWGGPGRDLQLETRWPTEVTVLMFGGDGAQIGKEQFEASGSATRRLTVAAGTALVGIATQACDRVVYTVAGGEAVLTFSTCAGAMPAAGTGVKDVISFERAGLPPMRLPLTTLVAAERLAEPVRMSGGSPTVAADPASFASVLRRCKGGETVLLADGDYGVFEQRGASGFAWWVVVKAAPGAKPVFERIVFHGTTNSPDGEHDQWLCFDGVRVEDGVEARGARWLELRNCHIRRRGEVIGSMRNIEKAGVGFRQCRGLRVEGCEVTNAGNGISGTGNHIIYRRNHVHRCGQDGFHYLGGHDFLCEYNDVHDLDDGVSDAERGAKPWNMHSDGIQMYPIWESDRPSNWLADCTLRGNRFYRAEAMGWMIQAKRPDEYRRFLIENNITAASPGYMFHFKDSCDGVVLRFNTFLIPTEGFQFTGWNGRAFDTRRANNLVAVPSSASHTTFVEVYGNILGGRNEISGPKLSRCDNNLYYGAGGGRSAGPGERSVGTPPFADVTSMAAIPTTEAVVGRLAAAAPAGPRARIPLPAYDGNGNPRSAQVCLGAIDPAARPPVKQEVTVKAKRKAAAPAAVAAPPPKAIDPGLRQAWDARLIGAVQRGLGGRVPPSFTSRMTGGLAEVEALSPGGAMVVRFAGGGVMDLQFQRLDADELAGLAGSSAADAQEKALLRAFYLFLAGRRDQAERALDLAGPAGDDLRRLFDIAITPPR